MEMDTLLLTYKVGVVIGRLILVYSSFRVFFHIINVLNV